MAHNADSLATEGKKGKGQNNHSQEKPRDMAVTTSRSNVAYRLRMEVGARKSQVRVDRSGGLVKEA
jgi:hypothetical protein